MEQTKRKKWKRRAAAGVAAAAASAGVLVGAAFDSPADVLAPDGDTVAGDLLPSDESGETEERRQRGGAVRQWIAAWPTAARAALALPLWAVGWGLSAGAGALGRWLLTPLGGQVLSWLIGAGAAVGLGAAAVKALFPGIPLKKLLRPRTLLWAAVIVLALGALDTALTLLWKDYPPVGQWLRLLGVGLGIGACLLASRRRKHALAPEAPPAPDAGRTEVERRAMALADSVCPPTAQ